MKMNRRSGGFGNRGNYNRFNDHHNNQGQGRMNQNRGGGGVGVANNYGGQQQQWRQQHSNQGQGRQSGGNQGGGGGMNVFDNRQFQPQQQQQQQMMNHQNQFNAQLSNAVMRSSVGHSNAGMMSSFGGNQDQPVVMVLPQSQATGGMMGGNMGMGMQSQNPFADAVMNQQKPMQVIVGNLPGLNPAAFGQQVLPTYGQGVGAQNMGMFGQQTQQGSSNRFGRDNKMSSDRGGRIQRNQKVSLVRRYEANDRGRVAAPRGMAKKRAIVSRDGYVDAKKAKTTGGIVARNRVGGAAGVTTRFNNRLKNRRPIKPATGNKAAAKTDKKEDAKEATEANGEVEETEKTEDAVESAATEPEEPKPSKYEEIPVEFLVCKVCQKTMNDAPSFESHLTGKAHLTRVKIVEEKFSKRAVLLMCESKMCEDEIAVEMERQRRAGKGGHGGKGNKNHCKMCDCNYTVNWGTHKQSVWHRVLKEFLHPNCRFCKSQFVHRRDWVEHILSVAHMKKLVELKQEGKISVLDQENTSQEELFAVHIEVTKDDKTMNILNIHSLGGRQPLTDDIKNMLAGEKGEIVLPEGEIAIPEKFEENTIIGRDAIILVGGTCCKVCRIYINEGDDGEHCKSRQHFDAYVEYLKRVVKLREQKAEDERKAIEEAERKAKAEAEAAAKAVEEAAKAAEAKLKAEASGAGDEAKTEVKPAAASPAVASKPEQMEVDQAKPATPVVQKEDTSVEKTEEVQATPKTPSSPVKTDAAKPSPAPATPTSAKSPPKTTPNSRGARGSPARGGRGAPNRGGGGGFGRGRGAQQTPARNSTPGGNMRGGQGRGQRGGGGRGGARGSPGRARGRGGW